MSVIFHVMKLVAKMAVWLMPRGSIWRRMLKTRLIKMRFSERYFAHVYGILHQQFIDEAYESDMLAFGSSHIEFGFIPDVCRKNAWNFGVISCDLRTIYYQVKYALTRNPRAQFIVGIDFWMQSMQTEFSQYFPVCMILDELGIVPLRNRFLKDHYQSYTMADDYRIHSQDTFSRGYWKGKEGLRQSVEDRAAAHLKFMGYKPTELAWLKKTIALFEDNKSNLLIVFPPVRPDYAKEIGNLRKCFDEIRKICQNYRIVDLSDDPRFCANDFFDCDHLNEKGGEKFTMIVEAELESTRHMDS